MNETFIELLQSPGHWAFEIFLMLVFDGIVLGLLWPTLKKHWRHHLDHDRRDWAMNPVACAAGHVSTPAGLCPDCHGVLIVFEGGDYCPGCGNFDGLDDAMCARAYGQKPAKTVTPS
jgi:hypothetical protein